MPNIGDYEFYNFHESVKTKFEVRVTVDANGSPAGYIKKESDDNGNHIYNYYGVDGSLHKQDFHSPANPSLVKKYYENKPNLGSLDFVLTLLRDNEALQIKHDNLLEVVVAQADKLRVVNNEKLLDDLTVKVRELQQSMPEDSPPDDSPLDAGLDMTMDDMFGMEPF